MKVLVIEDDKKLNQLICESLQEINLYPIAIYSAKEAINMIKKAEYSMAIVDWVFDNENFDGNDLILAIKRKDKKIPVIMLTGRGTLADKAKSFKCGTDDYIVKPFYLPELIMRVEVLKNRHEQKHDSNKILHTGPISINTLSYKAQVSGKDLDLNNKEFQLLKEMVKRRGNVITRAELVEKIWDDAPERMLSNTIDVHIRRLRKKLESHGDIIKTVRGTGYCLEV